IIGDGNPHAADDTNSVDDDGLITAASTAVGITTNLLHNDTLFDSDDGFPSPSTTALHVTGAGASNASNPLTSSGFTTSKGATVHVNQDGSYSYDPSTSTQLENGGTDSFLYQITDANGHSSSATVTITVAGDGNPHAADDTNSVDDDGLITAASTAVGITT